MSSTPRTQAIDYHTAPYGQQQQYPSQAYADMLLDEAQELYDKLAKDLVDEIITDYASSTSSSLLPLLPPSEERESNPTTTAANQVHMHTEEHGFTQQKYMMTIKMQATFYGLKATQQGL